MREVIMQGLALRKLQPGVYKLDWQGTELTIESRGIYSWTAYATGRVVFKQAGSLPALLKEIKGTGTQP